MRFESGENKLFSQPQFSISRYKFFFMLETVSYGYIYPKLTFFGYSSNAIFSPLWKLNMS